MNRIGERLEAFALLLALQDPSHMRRGHVWTQPGDPAKSKQLLEQSIQAFLVYRRLAADPDPVLAPARTRRVVIWDCRMVHGGRLTKVPLPPPGPIEYIG